MGHTLTAQQSCPFSMPVRLAVPTSRRALAPCTECIVAPLADIVPARESVREDQNHDLANAGRQMSATPPTVPLVSVIVPTFNRLQRFAVVSPLSACSHSEPVQCTLTRLQETQIFKPVTPALGSRFRGGRKKWN
jgi:hypothetical protein